VGFRQYISKEQKHSGIKLQNLCDMTRHTYDMKVYLGKDREGMAQQLTVIHATVTNCQRRQDVATNYAWTTYFPPPIQWFENQLHAVELSA
jgi:hypothetical protein